MMYKNNLDVHSKSGMCQITIENVLFSDNHLISKGLSFAVIFPFLCSFKFDFSSVCMYLFLVAL